MSQDTSAVKTMQMLKSTEVSADKIMVIKQEIIGLDKRRQGNRTAVREIQNSDCKNVWMTIGSMLVKAEKSIALDLVQKDITEISAEINVLRTDQKLLLNQHRDAEFQLPFTGSQLKPLSSSELLMVKPTGMQ